MFIIRNRNYNDITYFSGGDDDDVGDDAKNDFSIVLFLSLIILIVSDRYPLSLMILLEEMGRGVSHC